MYLKYLNANCDCDPPQSDADQAPFSGCRHHYKSPLARIILIQVPSIDVMFSKDLVETLCVMSRTYILAIEQILY